MFHHRPRRLKDEDTIYTERVQGYSKSLKDDALREVREAKEAAERARLEEQERAAQAAREEKERQDAERYGVFIGLDSKILNRALVPHERDIWRNVHRYVTLGNDSGLHGLKIYHVRYRIYCLLRYTQ